MAKKKLSPIGQAWLRSELNLAVPLPAVESWVGAGARRTEVQGNSRIVEQNPRQYATDGSIAAHLRFALRHEPVDLGVLVATLKAIEAAELEAWVRAEPTGAFSRRAWFFYETFTGRRLDLEDVRAGNYVMTLDPGKQIVAGRRNSPRHPVADNLLGGPGLCPTIRRTPRLMEQIGRRVDAEARALIESCDPVILARPSTTSTPGRHAPPSPSRARPLAPGGTERFVAVLKEARDFDPADRAALRSRRCAGSSTCRTAGLPCSCASACRTEGGCPRRNGSDSRSWMTRRSPRWRRRSGMRWYLGPGVPERRPGEIRIRSHMTFSVSRQCSASRRWICCHIPFSGA